MFLRSLPFLSAAIVSFLSAQPAPAQELDETSFERWRDFVLPAEGEERWLDVGWRAAFWGAVLEAHESERPVLLWAMNGHPLGCT